MVCLEFEYRVLGAGWAEGRLARGADEVELSASYLSDALGDLIEAVALVVEGVPSTQCSWLEEPGEFRWRFLRSDGDVLVEILWLDDWDKLDHAGQLVFSDRVPVLGLGRVILSEAQRVLDALGPEEYRRRWIEHEFPVRPLDRLKSAIRQARTGTAERDA